MNIKSKLAGGALSIAVCLAAGAPAFAGSIQSDAFVTAVTENVDVLTRSSQMAVVQSPTDAVKIFAKGELGTENIAMASNGVTTLAQGLTDADLTIDPTVFKQPIVGVSFPAGSWSLPYLKTTDGKGFDWTYKAVQEDALTRLQGLYSAYSVNGDDPGLRALAMAELPTVVARLNALHEL